MRSLVSQVDLLVARATGDAARGTCQQKAGKRERERTICGQEGWGRFRRSPSGLGPALEVVKRDATMHTRSVGQDSPSRWDPSVLVSRDSSVPGGPVAQSKSQTHMRLKRSAVYFDENTTLAHFRGKPLFQATKQHLNNSKMMENEM